jgi:hypothetical protein
MYVGWVVAATDGGIVVISNDSTTLIAPDGSSESGEGPPIDVTPTAGCCGSVVGIPSDGYLIYFDAYRPATWLLDLGDLEWVQLGNRNTTGDVLGWAPIGDDVYVVSGKRGAGLSETPVEMLDTNTWEWAEVAPIPHGMSVGGVTTDGSSLIVAGVTQDSYNNVVVGGREPVVYQLRDGVWSQLPDAPIDGQAATITWVDGLGLLAWNYELDSTLLHEDDMWETLGSVPMDLQECYPVSFQTESGVVAACGGLAFLDAETKAWSPIATDYEARYIVSGDVVYELRPLGDVTRLAVHEVSAPND